MKFSSMFLRYLVCWPSVDFQIKFYGELLRRGGALNARGVAKCDDLCPIEGYISETVLDRR